MQPCVKFDSNNNYFILVYLTS